MPRAPSTCLTPRCTDIATDRGRCRKHHLASRQRIDQARPTAHQRGYDADWRRTRAVFLADHPLCECDRCAALPPDARRPAVDVHHRDGLGPRGPRGHDPTNLQALAHEHHSQTTARQQPGGFTT